MAIPNFPTVCHVTMVFQRDTRIFVNTFHLRRDAGWTLPFVQQAAVDTISWWNLYYKAAIPAAVSLTAVQVRQYNPAGPIAYDQPVSPASAGTRVGVAESANATLTMSWRTGFSGRTQRGRIYVPSLPEADVSTADTVGSVELGVLAAAAAQFIGPLWSNSVYPVIFHRAPAPGASTINSYILDNIVDSQRRRLPGRGR